MKPNGDSRCQSRFEGKRCEGRVNHPGLHHNGGMYWRTNEEE
jgi:hypothetical protein